MAIIPQKQLFNWKEIEELGDLQRLRLVLEHLPDEGLMRLLESERGHGRNDYPVRAVWNSILAGVVYEHASVESLRGELCRNGQLRWLCGFDLIKGEAAVPPAWAYTRFLRRLMDHLDEIEEIFDKLVEELGDRLEGFGRVLVVDGKPIRSHGRRRRGDENRRGPDGRRDTDADVGKKTYRGRREDGSVWERVKSWFGYKLHLVVDGEYELPVAFKVTRASRAELPELRGLLEKLEERHKELLECCEKMVGDRGYDDEGLIKDLWDGLGIKAVIDIRNMWKDGEETRLLRGTGNVVYDYRGTVYCYCPRTGVRRKMAYGGFESDRDCLKYRCPARHYEFECSGAWACGVRKGLRIKLCENRRIFTPLARSSYAWSRAYKKRTAVERVNSRLDVSFGLEHHFIRGMKKMRLRCGLALLVMVGMALGRVKEKQEEKLRSLVRSA